MNLENTLNTKNKTFNRFNLPFCDLLLIKLLNYHFDRENPLNCETEIDMINPFISLKEPLKLSLIIHKINNGDWSNFNLAEPFSLFFDENDKRNRVDNSFLEEIWEILYKSNLYDKIFDNQFEILHKSTEDISDDFDPKIYKIFNHDLFELNDEESFIHFKTYGLKEKRIGAKKSSFFKMSLYPNFNRYSWTGSFTFHESKVKTIKHPYIMFDRSHRNLIEKASEDSKETHKKFISFDEIKEEDSFHNGVENFIFFHLFYEDVAQNLFKYLDVLTKKKFRLVISHCKPISNETKEKLAILNPTYNFCLNIGRDILGFESSFNVAKPKDNSAIFFMHTKKSPHLDSKFVNYWINQMIKYPLEQKHFDNLVNMINNSKIDLIANATCREKFSGPGECDLDDFQNYKENIGLPFARGTMFLSSGKNAKDIFSKFSIDRFLKKPIITEKDHLCGGIPHIVERVLSYNALLSKGILWI